MATPLKHHGAQVINQAIDGIASAIATRHARRASLILLGIANGGIEFAARLATRLQAAGLKVSLGTVDISFHRDDIGHNPIPKESPPTFIPLDVNGATVILVDDVLHSGRTVKAALDELFDHGRPTVVELAVLVDRGGRKLPIAPDYCGLVLSVTDAQKVAVVLDPRSPAADKVVVLPAKTSSKHSVSQPL